MDFFLFPAGFGIWWSRSHQTGELLLGLLGEDAFATPARGSLPCLPPHYFTSAEARRDLQVVISWAQTFTNKPHLLPPEARKALRSLGLESVGSLRWVKAVCGDVIPELFKASSAACVKMFVLEPFQGTFTIGASLEPAEIGRFIQGLFSADRRFGPPDDPAGTLALGAFTRQVYRRAGLKLSPTVMHAASIFQTRFGREHALHMRQALAAEDARVASLSVAELDLQDRHLELVLAHAGVQRDAMAADQRAQLAGRLQPVAGRGPGRRGRRGAAGHAVFEDAAVYAEYYLDQAPVPMCPRFATPDAGRGRAGGEGGGGLSALAAVAEAARSGTPQDEDIVADMEVDAPEDPIDEAGPSEPRAAVPVAGRRATRGTKAAAAAAAAAEEGGRAGTQGACLFFFFHFCVILLSFLS